MSPAVQAKLLRVLQEREFRGWAATRALQVDVRVIAATNRDLEGGMARGRFREDLYYRLHVVEMVLPPLRERPGGHPAAGRRVPRGAAPAPGGPPLALREAREILLAYPWPGNVREIRPPSQRIVARSRTLRSSRTLPGQE